MLEAIILAGGFGTRLSKVISDVPKPMAPISGKPFLEILLSLVAEKGFDRVVLSLGHMSGKIIDHFGDQFNGLVLDYVIEASPLGTGGAVRLAMEKCTQDHVFVFNGDTFLDLEVEALEDQWLLDKRPIIVARHVPETSRYGRIKVVDKVAVEFGEKNASGPGLINAGCYLLNKDQLCEFALDQPFSLESEYLAHAVKQGLFNVHVTSGQFIDIGVPEDYQRAQNELSAI